MANLSAGSVTYSVKNLRVLGNSRKHNRIGLVFGDGSLTYPAGGIPITIGKLGCPNVVESMVVVAQGTSGYVMTYDQPNAKLVIKQASAVANSNALAEASTVAIAAQTIEVEVIGW